MRQLPWIVLSSIAFAAGCGGDDTIQLKPGQPIGEQEQAQIRSADERVDAEERANTPSPRKR